jgi:serine/threonine protein kinase
MSMQQQQSYLEEITEEPSSSSRVGDEEGIVKMSYTEEACENTSYMEEACENAKELHYREFPRQPHEASPASSSIDVKIPAFRKREIIKNKLLGSGAFGTVFEITGFVTSTCNIFPAAPSSNKILALVQSLRVGSSMKKDDDERAQDDHESRRFIAEHCIRKGGDARYAIKVLSPETLADKDLLTQGIADMATETRMLSSIEHPNIVKLRATASGTVFRPDYFLILDRLYDTLQMKCKKWYRRQLKYSGQRSSFFRSQRKLKVKEDDVYEERIYAAFDLSAAVAYLHSKRILHRDIKPQNIGFDIRGDIKIFDFGFAKQLPEDDGKYVKDENGLYKNMTGMCGSPRYMAPGKEDVSASKRATNVPLLYVPCRN